MLSSRSLIEIIRISKTTIQISLHGFQLTYPVHRNFKIFLLLNHRPQIIRQFKLHLIPIPRRKMYLMNKSAFSLYFLKLGRVHTHSQHNSHCISPVTNSSMPKSQIPHYNGPLWYNWLTGRPNFVTSFEFVGFDAATCSVSLQTFLNMQPGICMSSWPDLC